MGEKFDDDFVIKVMKLYKLKKILFESYKVSKKKTVRTKNIIKKSVEEKTEKKSKVVTSVDLSQNIHNQTNNSSNASSSAMVDNLKLLRGKISETQTEIKDL